MPDTAKPRVLVWLTRGGIVEFIADGEVEVEVIDFQNLEAGDTAPQFDDRWSAWIRQRAPVVLEDIQPYLPKFECGNCGRTFWDEKALAQIVDLHQRVSPGEPMPAGQCPHCGALVHVMKEES